MRDDFRRPRRIRSVRVSQQGAVLLGEEKSRRDRIDADAGIRQMYRQPFGEVINSCFGRALGADLGQRVIGAH